MFDNLSNREKVVAGIIGILLVVGLVENAPGLIILLVVFGILYMTRDRQEERQYSRDRDVYYQEEEIMVRQPEPVRRERPTTSEQIHPHALQAVRRAGIDPNEVKVLPVNIGLITFKGDGEPVIYHNRPVDESIDYVQPFVELRVPVTAKGKIRFEIFDNTRQRVFAHEDHYQLERGRNLIMPTARLPIHDEQDMDGRWEMRVTADNVILARHSFEWRQPNDTSPVPLAEDGEISSELRAIIAESRLQQMSLDELLAHQEDQDGSAPPDYMPKEGRQGR